MPTTPQLIIFTIALFASTIITSFFAYRGGRADMKVEILESVNKPDSKLKCEWRK